MTPNQTLNHLPDWPHAGKRSDSLPVSDPARAHYHETYNYLIPKYPPDTDKRVYRDQDLLDKRVKRFFYSCEPRLDVECTASQISNDIAKFDAEFEALNKARADEGKEAFSLATPYRSLNGPERQLLSDGATIVGAAVNRLGRLGRIIIQKNRSNVRIEYDDAYVAEHLADIEREFVSLYIKLTDESHKSLVRCVLTRNERVDHDGVFHHLIRELMKPVAPHMQRSEAATASITDESKDAPIVEVTRQNILTEINHCVGAIDEVDDAIAPIYTSRKFAALIEDVNAARKGDNPLITPRTHDLNMNSFVSNVQEYVTLSRARACLKSEDHENCAPVARRLRHLRDTLAVQQGTLFKYADSTGNLELRNSIKLVARGIELIEEMAELRLPRNSKANGIYDQELDTFKGRDASSVGRFKEKVARDIERWQDAPGIMVNKTARLGTAAACASTANEVRTPPKAPWQQRMETSLANTDNSASAARG